MLSRGASSSVLQASTDFLHSPGFRYAADESDDDEEGKKDKEKQEEDGPRGAETAGGQDVTLNDSSTINIITDATADASNHSHSRSGDSDQPANTTDDRYDALSRKLDFLDGELRRRVGELVDAAQRIATLEGAERDLHTALKVTAGCLFSPAPVPSLRLLMLSMTCTH